MIRSLLAPCKKALCPAAETALVEVGSPPVDPSLGTAEAIRQSAWPRRPYVIEGPGIK
jgi:hypothetical protein